MVVFNTTKVKQYLRDAPIQKYRLLRQIRKHMVHTAGTLNIIVFMEA